MPSITKNDLICTIQEKTGINQFEIKTTIECFLHCVRDFLIEDRTIEIRGFGTFATKYTPDRIGQNVKKRIPVLIPACKRIKLKFSEEVKKGINYGPQTHKLKTSDDNNNTAGIMDW